MNRRQASTSGPHASSVHSPFSSPPFCVWEYIGGCGRADGLNNEVTIYAYGPAIFYVDDASVEYDTACAGKS